MAELFNIYCDESCHLQGDNSQVMVLGSVKVKADEVADASSRLREIKIDHRLMKESGDERGPRPFELKWQKVSPAKLDYYLDVVDYFFDNDHLSFRGLVVPDKSRLDHAAFEQDHDTWYYKMCFTMLEPLIYPRHRYRVYLDIKDTRSENKRKKLEEVLRNSRHDSSGSIIEFVQQIRSHESELMQLADLIMGAVCHHNRGLETSRAKREVIRRIQRRSAKSLQSTTWLRESKLNLLVWAPGGGG